MRAALVVLGVAVLPSAGRAQFSTVSIESRAPLRGSRAVVDEVVASIATDVTRPPVFVLASEVELTLRFELATRGAPSPLTIEVDETVSRAMLEQVLGERLLERESLRVGDPRPTDEQVTAERVLLTERLAPIGGPDALLAAVGADASDFTEFVRRRVQVAQFLERHLARAIEPTESELRAAYTEERFGAYRAEGVGFAIARPEIRTALMRQGYPAAIRGYLRSLGGRATIRLWAHSPELP